MMGKGRVGLAVFALLVGGALPLRGQILIASGQRDLTFGTIFPGVPEVVRRTDATSGRFNLRGQRRLEVRIVLTLPVVMTRTTGGNTMPIAFGAADGGFNRQNNVGTSQVFDPRAPLVTRLGNNGRLFIWLGGTAMPSSTQRSGIYQATITLTAAYTGN